MLDILDFADNGIGVQAQKLKEFCESLVAGFNVLSYLPTGGCQGESPIPLIIDKATPGEPPHHVRYGRSAEIERRGKIGNASIAFLLDQLLDPLQMVFAGFRASGVRRLCLSSACGHARFL